MEKWTRDWSNKKERFTEHVFLLKRPGTEKWGFVSCVLWEVQGLRTVSFLLSVLPCDWVESVHIIFINFLQKIKSRKKSYLFYWFRIRVLFSSYIDSQLKWSLCNVVVLSVQFGWTHVTLLIVVTQSHLIIHNLFEGMIWWVNTLYPLLHCSKPDLMSHSWAYSKSWCKLRYFLRLPYHTCYGSQNMSFIGLWCKLLFFE